MKELKIIIEHVVRSILQEEFRSPPPGFLEGSIYKMPVYHGSNNPNIEEFDPEVSTGDYGIHVSPLRKYARLYGSHLYEALINIKNPLIVEYKGEISPGDLTKEDIDKLKERGYDSIVVGKDSSIDQAHEIVLFEPSQVWIIRKS